MSDDEQRDHLERDDAADTAAPASKPVADAPAAPSPTKQPPPARKAGRTAYKPFSWR